MRQLLTSAVFAASRQPVARLALIGLVLLAAAGTSLIASPAVPDKPVTSHFTFTDSGTLNGLCAFPIHVELNQNIRETDYFDGGGALVRASLHVVERDTFTANNTSLVGDQFTFNLTALFDAGDVTHLFADGVVEKVRLPNGGLFLSAGRLDFAAHGFPFFLITPDAGATVNLAGFCAALAH